MTDKMTEEEVNKILNNPKQKRHEITITMKEETVIKCEKCIEEVNIKCKRCFKEVVYIMCDCGEFYINKKFYKKMHLNSNSHNGF